MCEVERNHYNAFLSSVGSELGEVRAAIHDRRKDRSVWVAEICRKDIDGIDDRYASPNELVWRNGVCLAGVRKSDALIWLLVSRDGYSKFAGSALRVSLIEAEVMQAVFDLKPIYVVRISTKESQTGADESVDGLVSLLKKSYPLIKETNLRSVFDLDTDRNDLLSHIDSLLKRLTPLAGMTRRLLKFRLRAGIRSRLSHSRRLVEARPVGRATIPLKHIEETLREAESRKHDYSYRLALLWVIKRNLQSWIDSEECPPEVEGLLVRTLKTWQTAAAWYGIHRHFGWGRFEAINELAGLTGISSPGAKASLHYSIARTGALCARGAALRRIDAALKQAKTKEVSDPSGVLLIEAHRETRWFNPRRKRKAVRLAYRALLGRRRSDDSQGRIGEAQIDFGWRLILCGLCRRGVSEAQSGFHLVKASDAVEPGFVVQKTRVLGMCYLFDGRIVDGLRALATANREAKRYCAFDQVRWYTFLPSAVWGNRPLMTGNDGLHA